MPEETLFLRNWSTSQGLPHNVVSKVAQDRNGYIWMATLGGLARFDGRRFKAYPVPERGGSGQRNIRDMVVLPDNSILFIHASRGLLQLENEIIHEHPLAKELVGFGPLQLYVEPDGAIWVGSSRGLVRWENGRIDRFPPEEDVSQRPVYYSWAVDRLGKTWVAGPNLCAYYEAGRLVPALLTTDGDCYVAASPLRGLWIFAEELYSFDGSRISRVADNPWPPEGTSFRAAFEDRAGTLWISSSRDGLSRLDGNRFQPVSNVRASVRSISEDTEGNLWLGTNGTGVLRARRSVFSPFELQASCVSEDMSGTLWFACGTAGIGKRDPAGGNIRLFPPPNFAMTVNTVCADLAGNLWIGTAEGLFRAPTESPSAMRYFGVPGKARITFCSRSGEVWVAGRVGGLGGRNFLGYVRNNTYFPLGNPLPPSEELICIAEDSQGRIYFGGTRGGLYEFAEGAIVPSKLMPDAMAGNVESIWPDEQGLLWVGTTDGLLCLGGNEPRLISKADGLPDDFVQQVVGDDSDNLWLTSPVEIYRIGKSELIEVARGRRPRLQIISYATDHGLANVAPRNGYAPSAIKDSRGNLWFCTFGETVNVNPASLRSTPTPVPLLIEELRVDGHAVPVPAKISMTAGDHRLELQFAAPSFIAPEKIMLRHRLEGFDVDWVNTPSDWRVQYAKLAPASYRLRVMACNADGVWNAKEMELAIEILPLWWQRTSVRIGAVLIFAGVVSWLVRLWSHRKLTARVTALEQERAIEAERTRIARDMHDELGGSVTGINLLVQRLVDNHTPLQESIVKQLDRNVHRLTVELERVVWSVSPKNSTLDGLATFIESFARNLLVEYEIDCRFKRSSDMPKIPLSPESQHHILAAIKEAFTNTLKHSRASEVQVELNYHKGLLTVSIRDNGVGFVPTALEGTEGNGLQNMRSRMAEIEGTIKIHSEAGAGTEIVMSIPVPERIHS